VNTGLRTCLVAMVTAVLTISCGGQQDRGSEVLVSAAASLTDAFVAIEEAFERANPEIEVVLNFGGSASLREQILAGAPADVFASANLANMDVIVQAGLTVADAQVFATNSLAVAVPPGNPGAVAGLADFARPELLLGVCADGVPCGVFAREALARTGVEPSFDTNEPDVRSLLTKVEAGELDAGIVYVTDIAAGEGRVEGLAIPPPINVVASYPIAVLSDGEGRAAGGAFVEYVLSADGRAILDQYGFGAP
jgi:molybdate transport system substrate-binding protein